MKKNSMVVISRWGSRPAHVGMSLQTDVGESVGGERPGSVKYICNELMGGFTHPYPPPKLPFGSLGSCQLLLLARLARQHRQSAHSAPPRAAQLTMPSALLC